MMISQLTNYPTPTPPLEIRGGASPRVSPSPYFKGRGWGGVDTIWPISLPNLSKRLAHLLLYLLLISSLRVLGQTSSTSSPVTKAFNSYRQQTLPEKLFVHTDQTTYLTGETLWFSVYYVDGTFHKPLDLSKVAYLELLDKEGKSVLQTKVALVAGGGNGTLFLPASLRSGSYLIRAYTNWMKNDGAGYFFEKPITIVNPFVPLDPPAPNSLADNYDIQLFPEGGHLVQGLASKVAFKVADASGRGVPVRGYLLNGQNDTLSRFTAFKFGMGSFMLTPVANVTYRVLMQDERGRSFTRSLPAIAPQGYVMRVEESSAEQLTVSVSTNVSGASSVFMFAHTRNAVKLAESKAIQGETRFSIDKKALGEGISHLTLFDASQQPVCERLYFKRPAAMPITLLTDQPEYAARTSVRVDATVPTAALKTGPMAMSVAVYRLDSLGAASSENILSNLWLTSDLPGYVESPDYYLQPGNPDVAQAADNLMLTHGWRRFTWASVLNPQRVAHPFIPEINGPVIQATVTDPATGKPLPDVITFLSTVGKPIRLYVSNSDSAGRVRFEMRDFFGQRDIVLQTGPQDSTARLTITNPFSDVPASRPLPDFFVPEARADQLLSRSVAMQVQSAYGTNQSRYVYPAIDSAAFYGKPSETYLLDAYTRFPRTEEVLREYVPGVLPRKRQGRFRLEVLNLPYRAIFEEPALMLIDGVPVFDGDKVIEFSPLKVKQLDVLTNRYFLGQAQFSGIVSFMTYKGDLAAFPLDAHVLKLDYDGLQLRREFYAPRYDQANPPATRLPDARTLLYWNPAVPVNASGTARLDVATSDQTGTYLVEVNGLTKDGQAGSQQTVFRVKNALK